MTTKILHVLDDLALVIRIMTTLAAAGATVLLLASYPG